MDYRHLPIPDKPTLTEASPASADFRVDTERCRLYPFGWMSNNTQTLTLMQGEQTHYLLQAKDRYPVQKLLLWVGKSAIAGRGLFTAQAIKSGRRIIQYTGEKITKVESDKRLAEGNVYIFALNERYDIDAKVQRHQARYINHSCNPNCHVEKTTRTIWIVASRDISAGEELTYNYGYELTDTLPHSCTCGATNCCGSMVAPEYQEVIRQRRAVSD
jgi:SET domain-containing protein